MSKNEIKYFPVTTYSSVMGVAGLAIAMSKFAIEQWLPNVFYLVALGIATLMFVVITAFYLVKTIFYFNEVKIDFKHKIRINFFSTFSISILLLSIGFHPLNYMLSEVLWWIGTIIHTYLMLHTISFWIQHNFEIKFFNPAWFIPVVGNIIVPIMGVEYMPKEFLFFYFSVGMFFWLVLFTIFINRVVFHDQIPQKFMPTFFILIAPPAIGVISYVKLTGNWDMFSQFLISITFFFILLLVFLVNNFRNIKFFISWWAFIFPLDAFILASTLAYQQTGLQLYKYIAWGGMVFVVGFVLLVLTKTIQTISKGELCIKED